ncbi:MAG TPA: glycosyltransferase, partial [Roseiflexaceae bacterium]|nr:glycosyltransferase [Roseiflexaceae bacterium]
MHLVIDARTVADHFPGIGRYVYQLVEALAAEHSEHRLTLLYAPRQRNTRFGLAELARRTGVTLVSVGALPFSAGEHLVVPQVLRILGADLYHAPYYVRPYFGLPCPAVTTLYDAIPVLFPHSVSWQARRLFVILHRLAIASSRRIITISHSARADLQALFGSSLAQAAVVPL